MSANPPNDAFIYLFELKLCLEAAGSALRMPAEAFSRQQIIVAVKFIDQASDATELLEAELHKELGRPAND